MHTLRRNLQNLYDQKGYQGTFEEQTKEFVSKNKEKLIVLAFAAFGASVIFITIAFWLLHSLILPLLKMYELRLIATGSVKTLFIGNMLPMGVLSFIFIYLIAKYFR